MKKYVLDGATVDQDTWEKGFRKILVEQLTMIVGFFFAVVGMFASIAPFMPKDNAPTPSGQSVLSGVFFLATLILLLVGASIFYFRSLHWKSIKMGQLNRHLSDAYVRSLNNSPLNPVLIHQGDSDGEIFAHKTGS